MNPKNLDEKLMAEFEIADDYWHERRLRAKRFPMPPEPKSWLSDLETRIKTMLPRLPEPTRSEYSVLMAEQIKDARRLLALDEQEAARITVALLFDNYRLIQHNIDLKDAAPARKGRSAGGHSTAEQKREEAEQNVAEVMERWQKLEAQGKPERERAAIIAYRMGRPVNTVRTWIKKAGLR